MMKRQILINALMSVVQIVVIGGILFVLYRFLLNTIGVEKLGIWSLVLATTSVTRIADMGLSASIVKYVAKYIARGENANVSNVIQTVFISIGIFIGLILLIAYPFATRLLKFIIPGSELAVAISILPFAFLSLWITSMTSIFLSGLDGYQRIDLRSILVISISVFHLLLCFWLAPIYGLNGLAYAHVIQASILLFGSWFLLKVHLKILPLIPYRWNYKIFKEIIGYGLNFQLISATTLFYDPTTKALLGKFGGLAMVGFYEMANKMVQQFRSLIVSANQVLVPAIANLQEKSPEKVQSVYLSSYRLLLYLSFPLYGLIIVCIPIISELWIGHYEKSFVIFGTLLSFGWLMNTISAPAYFANLGTGELRWNVISHMSIALMNAGLGGLLGAFFDGIGVVSAWIISLSSGSSLIYLSYHLKHGISLIELLPKDSMKIMIICLIGTLTCRIIAYKLNFIFNPILLNGILVILFLLTVLVILWVHPMRKHITEWVETGLLNRKSELHP